MLETAKKILELCEILHKAFVWLFKGSVLANFVRVLLIFGAMFITRYHDKLHILSYVKASSREHFTDPKIAIQDILLDLSARCGEGCYAMKISLHHSEKFFDGKPWSVFGYVKEVKQVMEVSSMQYANPINKNRFSISDETYRDIVYNSTIGTVRTLAITEIQERYSDIAGLLTGLRKDIGRYMYTVQRDENGKPLWIIAIAIVKGFEPRCTYYGKDDCIDLLLIKARDIHKAWLSQE